MTHEETVDDAGIGAIAPHLVEAGPDLGEGEVWLVRHERQDARLVAVDPMRAQVTAALVGRKIPRSRFLWTHLTAEGSATPNRAAAARRDIPSSTAATTRARNTSSRSR